MEEIKAGEYIRVKDGCIFKATEYWLEELKAINKKLEVLQSLLEEEE